MHEWIFLVLPFSINLKFKETKLQGWILLKKLSTKYNIYFSWKYLEYWFGIEKHVIVSVRMYTYAQQTTT